MQLAMKRGERIAEIPPQYQGKFSHCDVSSTVPWEPYRSFLEWISEYPRLIDCKKNEALAVAILKHAFQNKWTTIGSERFWYVHIPKRMRECNEYSDGVDNNIEDMLATVNVVVMVDIDRVEPKFHERLLNILLTRKRTGKITIFTVYDSIKMLPMNLQEFLSDARTA